MDGDHLRLDQGHIVDEQAHDALALAGLDAWVLPDPRQLLGEIENTSAGLGTEGLGLLFAAALVVFRGIGMTAQFVVPFRFERICDETVIGIELHITPPRELGVVVHSFDVLTPRGVGLSGRASSSR
jgi:hypothetical protein